MLHNLFQIMNLPTNSTQIRKLSYKKLRTWYAGLTKPKKQQTPYRHIVQIGDPCLRTISNPVPSDLITSHEVACLIAEMNIVFERHKCIGLSAPQVGVPLRLFMMEFNKTHASAFSEQERKNYEMKLMSKMIVINPEVKVLDFTKVVYPESCGSVKGFWAEVPRYKAIELKGFDENNSPILMNLKGWSARIVQHEFDHLNGIVYTDIMNRKTLTCSCWDVVNAHGGKVELPYGHQ